MPVKIAEPVDLATILSELSLHQIVLPNSEQVRGYLLQYPGLAQILPDICAPVREEFGPEVELSLELYRDPEIDDRYLTLYVREKEYGPDLMKRIESVRERVNPKLEDVPGDFLITTDFRPLRGENGVRVERVH
jgi:hypothetical protein